MSGFVAIHAHHAIPRTLTDAMLARGAHRGTARRFDDDGITLVAFDGRGDTSGLSVGDDLVVAFDGRLANRAALDPMIGVPCATDAIRLTFAWRRWGSKALTKLDGDFAGAVWDRHRKALTIFRDPTAGRHALIARAPGRVAAASSMTILLADEQIDRTADEDWVLAYLTGTPGFATATGYKGITRMQPGHLATAQNTTWRQSAWHSWRIETIKERDDNAYAERFAALLTKAVETRTEGAHRIGVSLSGGLDSTSIAATLRAARPDADLVALAVPFTDPRADERGLQALVARHLGAELHWAPLDGHDPFCGDPIETLERLGAPPIAPNHFFVERVATAGHDAGVEVALDGIDGDGVVGGNWTYLSDLLVTGRWRSLKRETRAMAEVHHVDPKAIRRAYMIDPLIPGGVRRAIARARKRPIAPAFLAPRLHKAAQRARFRKPTRPGASFTANERLLLNPGVAPAVLEAIDEAWIAKGIEPAHPFTDRALIAFCLGLPREQKVRAGMTKIVLRNAMRGLLPPEVTERAAKAEMAGSFFAGLSGSVGGPLSKGLALAPSNLSPWVHQHAIEAMSADGGSVEAFRTAFLAIWRAWADGSMNELRAREMA